MTGRYLLQAAFKSVGFIAHKWCFTTKLTFVNRDKKKRDKTNKIIKENEPCLYLIVGYKKRIMPVPKHSSMSLDFQYFRDTLNDLNTCWIKRLSLANYCSNFWLASAVSNTGMLLGYFCRRITLFKNISAKYQTFKGQQHPCSWHSCRACSPGRGGSLHLPFLWDRMARRTWQRCRAWSLHSAPQPHSYCTQTCRESTPCSEWKSETRCLRLCKL